MEQHPTPALIAHFAGLDDPRIERQKRHKLIDILVIAICAVLSGAEGVAAIEDFGHKRRAWLEQLLELPNGIPSHDTFTRVFRLLNPVQFQTCFLQWIQAVAVATKGEVVAIDGKRLRRSFEKATGKSAIHMVSAWATEQGLVLGQCKVDKKSNEITAIPQLLEILDLTGCIVTIDAIGCQRAIADQITEGGGDYVLMVKGNQKTLHQDIQALFAAAREEVSPSAIWEYEEQQGKGHGREEIRRHWQTNEIATLQETHAWPGLVSVGRVEATRMCPTKTSIEQRFYVTSLEVDAPTFAHAVRAHWGIENRLHWSLDVTFREDASRLRKGHGPENFAVLRHIALNLLRREPSPKSLPRKRLACAWDPDYLLQVLLA